MTLPDSAVYPVAVPLGEVLTLAREIKSVNPEKLYPNLGIYSFGRGLFEKPPIDGSSTSAKTLYRVRAGQFIYSRLFAFEGAYGVVPDRLDGYFVSGEFPSFTCQTTIVLPEYLRWLFTWRTVWTEIASASSKGMGNRRQRVHPERLLGYQIRLPSLDEQRRIVSRLAAAAARVEKRHHVTENIDREVAATLRAAFRRVVADAARVPLGDVAPLVRRSIEIDLEETYTEIGIRSFFKGTFHRRTVSGAEFTWQKLFRIRAGDLIFSNLMAWEQAIAVATPEDEGCVGNHRMLTCEADPSRGTSRFLWYYFTTPEGFSQVISASPGTIARNKTLSAELLPSISVPNPSLDAQRWFDEIQVKARAARAHHSEAAAELDQFMPALLDRTFS